MPESGPRECAERTVAVLDGKTWLEAGRRAGDGYALVELRTVGRDASVGYSDRVERLDYPTFAGAIRQLLRGSSFDIEEAVARVAARGFSP